MTKQTDNFGVNTKAKRLYTETSGMTEKRFDIQFDTVRYFLVVDVPNERCVGRFDTMGDAKGYLELYEYFIDIEEELQRLKKENKGLKEQLRNLRRLVNETYMEGSE